MYERGKEKRQTYVAPTAEVCRVWLEGANESIGFLPCDGERPPVGFVRQPLRSVEEFLGKRGPFAKNKRTFAVGKYFKKTDSMGDLITTLSILAAWLNMNWIEITGAGLTLLFLYLEVSRKWTMWIVGILSGLFYVYINFDVKLYALAGLCSYNVAVSVYGIYCWKFARTKSNESLPFRFISSALSVRLVAIGAAIFAAIAFVLLRFTDIASPWGNPGALFAFLLDNLITTLSILAAWMAARKIVESWYLWMFINPCTIALYVYKGMYPSTVLYVIYAIFSVVGYIQWRKIAVSEP
jgi:nicotinamide mononucleotide transporter